MMDGNEAAEALWNTCEERSQQVSIGNRRRAENGDTTCTVCFRNLRAGEPLGDTRDADGSPSTAPRWHFFGSGRVLCPECYEKDPFAGLREAVMQAVANG